MVSVSVSTITMLETFVPKDEKRNPRG